MSPWLSVTRFIDVECPGVLKDYKMNVPALNKVRRVFMGSTKRGEIEFTKNCDDLTVKSFGEEWNRFDQSPLSDLELREMFDEYFTIFPWKVLPGNAIGFDLGCGSGRWGKYVAPRVGRLHCIDASDVALGVAKRNLSGFSNCVFHHASVDSIPLEDNTMDFGYCLGVLHHVPDTAGGIKSCVAKLKRGAPLLVYIYYALENRPRWYRFLWRITDILRRVISKSPYWVKYLFSQAIAITVYFPLARFALLIETLGGNPQGIPLSANRRRSFYPMRTDALDRFGTPLEQRFTKTQIHGMMTAVGLEKITFTESGPYWCAVGYKKF